MDIVEAIGKRKSIRAYKSDPVPRKVLQEILDQALRAPSWANTQPWEFAVAGGAALDAIRKGFMDRLQAGKQMAPDLPGPAGFPEPFDSRRRAVGIKMFDVMGIKREDKQQRIEWGMRGFKLFEAPNAIFLLTDRAFYSQEKGLNVWPVYDCGSVGQNVMLLAPKYGLGTIPAIQAVAFPDVIREVLKIPDSKLIVLGIAIGYPDWDHPSNTMRTDRESVESLVNWYDVD